MNTKQKLLGAAITLAMGMSGTANAFSVNTGFGSGSLNGITGFDWAPGSAYSKDSLPLPTEPLSKKFEVYSQAALAAYQTNGLTVGDTNLNTKYQITYVAGFGEFGAVTSTSALFGTSTATFGFDPTASVNFFKIFYTDLTVSGAIKADNLLGTGFDNINGNGIEILSGLIVAGSGSNQTQGTFTVNTDPTTAGDLDQSPNGNNWGAQQTLSGNGSNKAVVQINSYNTTYLQNIAIGSLSFLSILNSNAVTPFTDADPSQIVAGQAVSLSSINGYCPTGTCNFLFQNDGSQTFKSVPEPDMIALLGLGLFGMGAVSRRKSA